MTTFVLQLKTIAQHWEKEE